MTEAEWFAGLNFDAMLRHPGPRLSDRKARLLACSCVRLVWGSLVDERCRQAVEIAELFADGLVSEYERARAEEMVRALDKIAHDSARSRERFMIVAAKMCVHRKPNVIGICDFIIGFSPGGENLLTRTTTLIRDTVGNPFRSAAFSPAWRTDTAALLARQMYEARDFSAMPILADALQDAGCDSADVLDHCRDANQAHVRGCWVVDRVLGRE